MRDGGTKAVAYYATPWFQRAKPGRMAVLRRLRGGLGRVFTDAANSCPLCFRTIQGGVRGGCQKKPPAFERMWASLYYEPPVSSMIRALKHLADLGMSRPLAELMRRHAPDWLETEHFDFVLPVPLS